MRLAICGEGRSGKDTVANWLHKNTVLRYDGSTSEAAADVVFTKLRTQYGYNCGQCCFEDRHNHREEWAKIIWDFNLPNGTTLYEHMMLTSDVLNGIRRKSELQALLSKGWINLSIWIERDVPNDPSCELTPDDCDIIIPNHGTFEELYERLERVTSALGIYGNNALFDRIGQFIDSEKKEQSCKCVEDN